MILAAKSEKLVTFSQQQRLGLPVFPKVAAPDFQMTLRCELQPAAASYISGTPGWHLTPYTVTFISFFYLAGKRESPALWSTLLQTLERQQGVNSTSNGWRWNPARISGEKLLFPSSFHPAQEGLCCRSSSHFGGDHPQRDEWQRYRHWLCDDSRPHPCPWGHLLWRECPMKAGGGVGTTGLRSVPVLAGCLEGLSVPLLPPPWAPQAAPWFCLPGVCVCVCV